MSMTIKHVGSKVENLEETNLFTWINTCVLHLRQKGQKQGRYEAHTVFLAMAMMNHIWYRNNLGALRHLPVSNTNNTLHTEFCNKKGFKMIARITKVWQYTW